MVIVKQQLRAILSYRLFSKKKKNEHKSYFYSVVKLTIFQIMYQLTVVM